MHRSNSNWQKKKKPWNFLHILAKKVTRPFFPNGTTQRVPSKLMDNYLFPHTNLRNYRTPSFKMPHQIFVCQQLSPIQLESSKNRLSKNVYRAPGGWRARWMDKWITTGRMPLNSLFIGWAARLALALIRQRDARSSNVVMWGNKYVN